MDINEFRDHRNKYMKEYRDRDPEKTKKYKREYMKEYRKNHPEKVSKEHYEKQLSKQNEKYRTDSEFRLARIEYQKTYFKTRKENDQLFKITQVIRKIVNKTIKGKRFTKKSRTHDILGCSFDEFKIYLESHFEP